MGTEGLGWVEIRGIVVPKNEFWHKRKKTEGLGRARFGMASTGMD